MSRRSRALLARVQWWIGLLFAGSALWFAFSARLPLPYRDDWDWYRWLLTATSPASYLVPHNEHVIPIARLLLRLQYGIEGSSGYTMLLAALASIAIIAVLTLGEIRRRWPDDAEMQRWAGGVSLVLLCFAWQLQSVVFSAAVIFPLVQVFAAAAIVCLLNAGESSGAARTLWLWISGAAALGAMLTTTNGFAVPVIQAMLAASRRMGLRIVAGFSLIAVAGALLYSGLVLLPRLGSGAPLEPLASPPLIAAFFAAFYASLVAQVSATGAVLLGTALFAAGLYYVVTTLGRPDRPRLEYYAAALLVFTMASAALSAPARASFGIVQVAQSRYASFAQPYWTSLFLLAMSRLSPQRASALAAPTLVASVLALGVQAMIGAVWMAKADNVATAGVALRSGANDVEWLVTLYPAADVPRQVAAALVADGDRSLGDAEMPLTKDMLAKTPVCQGTAQVVRVPIGEGLRMLASVDNRGDRGVLVDAQGTRIGLARPAPVADMPNPSPMEVARAVARSLRTPPARGRWIGFGTLGGAAPFSLVVLNGDGMPVCRVVAAGP